MLGWATALALGLGALGLTATTPRPAAAGLGPAAPPAVLDARVPLPRSVVPVAAGMPSGAQPGRRPSAPQHTHSARPPDRSSHAAAGARHPAPAVARHRRRPLAGASRPAPRLAALATRGTVDGGPAALLYGWSAALALLPGDVAAAPAASATGTAHQPSPAPHSPARPDGGRPGAGRPGAARRHWDGVGATGVDVSWPQCGGVLPSLGRRFAVVGVTGGRMFTLNPCLRAEWAWAASGPWLPQAYLNVGWPDAAQSDAYGGAVGAAQASVRWSLAALHRSGLRPARVWLDVELPAGWLGGPVADTAVVSAALAEVRRAGMPAGVYSTGYQWSRITGGADPGAAEWSALGNRPRSVAAACAAPLVAGGRVAMVQWLDGGLDADVACAPLSPR